MFLAPLIRLLPLLFALSVALDIKDPQIQTFIQETPQVSSKNLERWLTQAQYQPHILEILSHPAEKSSWKRYEQKLITPQRIQEGQAYLKEHQKDLELATARYHVDPQIITAILGIETSYGKVHYRYQALDALATIAFSKSPRAPYFRRELQTLLIYAQNHHLEPDFQSSYAGAIGIPQFMPSNLETLTDGSDLVHSHHDAILSVAKFLHHFGYQASSKPLTSKHPLPGYERITLDDTPLWVSQNFRSIRHYNTSNLYVMAVTELSQAL